MGWKIKVKLLEVYVGLMTQEQFERLEDALLEGEIETSRFTLREIRELELKLTERNKGR